MSGSPPTPERDGFAERLKLVRQQANFKSMAAFARKLGVEPPRYGKWERAESEPDLHHLCKIQEVTGVSLDFLIAGLVPGMIKGPFPNDPDAEDRKQSA